MLGLFKGEKQSKKRKHGKGNMRGSNAKTGAVIYRHTRSELGLPKNCISPVN